jgi:hypothetical protein
MNPFLSFPRDLVTAHRHRHVTAVCLLLVPFVVRATPLESPSRSILETVTVREYHDRHERSGLELSFPSLGPDPKLATLAVEEARALVVSLEKEFDAPKPRRKPSTFATWSLGSQIPECPG